MKVMAYGESATDYYENFQSKFHPQEVITKTESSPDHGKIRNRDDKSEQPEPDLYNETALITEIDALRRKIHKLENDNTGLRKDLSDKRQLQEENEDIKDRLDAVMGELAALRSYVYNLTENEEPVQNATLGEMKDTISKYRIVIIGGHSNWVNKMKSEFPNWVFVNHKASSTSDTGVVFGADHVYFFTDTISHSTYFKYMNVIREKKIDFGYIHGVNIDKNITQIYRELED